MLRMVFAFFVMIQPVVQAMPDFMNSSVKSVSQPAVSVEMKKMPVATVEKKRVSLSQESSYILGTGDQIKLTVFGEEELSGAFEVDGAGYVSLPLIGQMRAGEKDILAFEKDVTTAYADGYLVTPEVRVEVVNFRPFYIVGEVNNAGQYSYMSGLTVLNAVAIAGGYTPYARKKKIQVTRSQNGEEKQFIFGEKDLIQPGDLIEVKERFF